MRLFRRRERDPRLTEHSEWLARTMRLIHDHDPEAARRLSANIRDRLRIRNRDADPYAVVRDVTDMVIAELERLQAAYSDPSDTDGSPAR